MRWGKPLLHCCLFYPGSCRDKTWIELNHIDENSGTEETCKKVVPELRIFCRVTVWKTTLDFVFFPYIQVFWVGWHSEALRKQNSEPKGHSCGWGNHARWFLRPQCEESCRSKKHLSILGRCLAKNWCTEIWYPYYISVTIAVWDEIHHYHVKRCMLAVFSRNIHLALGLRNLPLPRRTVWPFRIIIVRPTNQNA